MLLLATTWFNIVYIINVSVICNVIVTSGKSLFVDKIKATGCRRFEMMDFNIGWLRMWLILFGIVCVIVNSGKFFLIFSG